MLELLVHRLPVNQEEASMIASREHSGKEGEDKKIIRKVAHLAINKTKSNLKIISKKN